MRLTDEGLKDRQGWLDHGYTLPQYDRERMRQATLATPRWIHFGAGNIFRAYQTRLMQQLIEAGEVSEGLIAAEGYDDEIVDGMLNPHDDLNILVTLKASGSVEKTVIGSLAAALKLDPASADFTTLRKLFIQPSLQLASFTITEKGYRVRDEKGQILPEIAAEFERGPQAALSYIGKVAALLSARYQNGALPIALVSMDNCSHNGEKLKQAIVTMAEGWTRAGKMEVGFLDYVQDEGQVSFPWTMIDKITPRPDPAIEALLKQDGVEDVSPIITARHTYIAPFVNAEECEYLVVEDRFPQRSSAAGKSRRDVRGPADGRAGGADEGFDLSESGAYRSGGVRLSARLHQDQCGNAGSGFKAAGGTDRPGGRVAGCDKPENSGAGTIS